MSGFVAIVNTDGAPVDPALLARLTETLHFRGPDRSKTWIHGSVGFGHALFRTTDEAIYENQPASLDGNLWIAGSIRIDARKELVNRLGMAEQIKLCTTPDSELVLHAYHAWGENCLQYLLGDFSFILWDSAQRKLYCAIDRFGMRQLYYSYVGSTFIASNSLHCMRHHPAVSDCLNDEAIGNFLLFGDQRWIDKTQTTFVDISTLSPAHYLILINGAVTCQRYWDLPLNVPLLRYRREQEYLDHFQDIFKTAVSDRLRTSKIAIFLSGGMDSSTIAATVRKIQREDNALIELNPVTVLYDSILPSDERYYVDLLVRCFRLAPHYIDGGQYPFLSPPVPTTRPLELYQPALWLEAERRAGGMGRVLLTGYAGDNLIAFSSIFQTLKEVNPVSVLKAVFSLKRMYGVYPGLGTGLRVKLKGLLSKTANCPFAYPTWLNREFENNQDLRLKWDDRWVRSSSRDSYEHLSVIYRNLMEPDWNTDDVYMDTDFTLPEKRDPFLDTRLIEFVLSLPALPWLFKKHLLRRSMHRILPQEITRRPKTALGNIHTSLLRRGGIKHVNDQHFACGFNKYIDLSKLPALSGKECEKDLLYVNLRPVLLNNWLRTTHRKQVD